MPTRKALILTAPQTIKFQEETLPELEPQQVLIRSVLSAFKHGTEMEAYFGSSPFLNKDLDFKWRVFQENKAGTSSILYPETLGNMTAQRWACRPQPDPSRSTCSLFRQACES